MTSKEPTQKACTCGGKQPMPIKDKKFTIFQKRFFLMAVLVLLGSVLYKQLTNSREVITNCIIFIVKFFYVGLFSGKQDVSHLKPNNS